MAALKDKAQALRSKIDVAALTHQAQELGSKAGHALQWALGQGQALWAKHKQGKSTPDEPPKTDPPAKP